MNIDDFITRWQQSGGSERANFQTFANELCDVLGVPRPTPASETATANAYHFEHPVTFIHTGSQTRGFVDLYRAGHFVMEAKQGVSGDQPDSDPQAALLADLPKATRKGHGTRGTRGWDDTMMRARNQADGYARAVSRTDGWPPFLLVVDVGHVIEVYADFSGQGQGYTQYPDGNRYRIHLDDLRQPETLGQLRTIWTDPHALDPSKISAQVTREVANRLAALGKSFEGQGHEPEAVANFLMRCLFTMFAEDVELIPKDSFSELLKRLRGKPEHAAPALADLWQVMDAGGFSGVLMTDLKRFNGGLFKDASALPLSEVQLSLLIDAAERDWGEVEPAIFGTLLERALDKKQRHKLGAHYTPRAYVERLVVPTIMEPLRADWRNVQAAALTLANQGKLEQARETVHAFHKQLCEIRVLDPACGSGNFLYVALELMKRLEGEVTALLAELGEEQGALSLAGLTVDPHQFLGIELNPWAAAVAELVLWIGYLQWHFRTHGKASPSEPVLRDFRNIENRDAVLTFENTKARLDNADQPVTRWDGESTITHPVTGEEVPDPQARVAVLDYIKPRPAVFPGGRVDDADFKLAATLGSTLDLDEAAHRVAAIRETLEETGLAIGINGAVNGNRARAARELLMQDPALAPVLEEMDWTLDLDAVLPFSRWFPKNEKLSRVFDTRFYLADLGTGAVDIEVDATENSKLYWITAQGALDAAETGDLTIIYPTRRNLERLAQFQDFTAAQNDCATYPADMITPFLTERDGQRWLCIPDDLGYPVDGEPIDGVLRGEPAENRK